MRLVLMLVALVTVYAEGTKGQGVVSYQSTNSESSGARITGKRVTIQLKNVALSDALDSLASQAGVRITYGSEVTSAKSPVSYSGAGVAIDNALSRILTPAGLVAVLTPSGKAFVVKRLDAGRRVADGVITGKIRDAKTGKGVAGANVSVGIDSRGVSSREDGEYRLSGITAGTHSVTVRLVGYAKQTRSVTVGEGATVNVDFRIEQSANVLDQVIVTGTVVQTELKAVPNAITIVTAKQIEERGITKIDQLFRGDVPGLFAQNQGTGPFSTVDEVTMFSRGATALSNNSAGTDFGTNAIKTYVDGVEMANSKYLSQIDPRSIERIEILTGPQASTIYGSNALNGVMQIFTKRGSSSRPQLHLTLMSGWIQNDFSNSLAPQHDYTAQVNGVEGKLSYSTGGSWNYIGPWAPVKQTARTGIFGGARIDIPTSIGAVTADVSLRRGITQNRERGDNSQTRAEFAANGWYNAVGGNGRVAPATSTLTGQTSGFVLKYAPASWWSHEFGIGNDVSDVDKLVTDRGYINPTDTLLLVRQNHSGRKSLRYSTTIQSPVTSIANLNVTAGADAWQSLVSSFSVSPIALTGTLSNVTSLTRQPEHNTGAFLQTQLGLKEKLFLTFGLRAEWHPNYGEEALPNYAPRYGVAYTQDVGAMSVKLRGSYGRSTRPPNPRFKNRVTAIDAYGTAWPFFSPYFDVFDTNLENPDLGPEHQQGGEGGMEFYFGTRGSLVVTRYNQTVDRLIAQPPVDSVRSLTPNPAFYGVLGSDNYGYLYQQQYLNIGSIRNQGWELQGTMNMGPLTTRGSYSWTKSRSIGVTPAYRWFFTIDRGFPQYQPGATFQYLPEHTWSLGTTYAKAGTSVGLHVSGIGQSMNLQDEFYMTSLFQSIRLQQNRFNMNNVIRYTSFNQNYATADLIASQQLLKRVEGLLQVQNLTNYYANDRSGLYATMGRQVKLGVRAGI